MLELPMGLALLLCDSVIEDMRTKKKSMIGVFSRINADKFPYVHPGMTVYISLTGCNGNLPCHLVCVKAGSNKPLMKIDCNVNAKTPRDVIDIVITVKSMLLNEPGVYIIKLLADGVPIMMRPFSVLEKTRSSSKPPAPDEPK